MKKGQDSVNNKENEKKTAVVYPVYVRHEIASSDDVVQKLIKGLDVAWRRKTGNYGKFPWARIERQ